MINYCWLQIYFELYKGHVVDSCQYVGTEIVANASIYHKLQSVE